MIDSTSVSIYYCFQDTMISPSSVSCLCITVIMYNIYQLGFQLQLHHDILMYMHHFTLK